MSNEIPAFEELAARMLLGFGLEEEFTLHELKRSLDMAAKQYGTKHIETERFPREVLMQSSEYLHKAYTALLPLIIRDGEPFKPGFPFAVTPTPDDPQPLSRFLREFG